VKARKSALDVPDDENLDAREIVLPIGLLLRDQNLNTLQLIVPNLLPDCPAKPIITRPE
jgi:hypothetical protein